MQSYARHLQAADITGGRLLQLRPGGLRQLNITRVGHQEVILAAISRLQTLVRRGSRRPDGVAARWDAS